MRRGRFFIVKERQDLADSILGALSFTPTRATRAYDDGMTEHEGCSPLFREISTGDSVPEYLVTTFQGHYKVKELSNAD